MDTVCYKQRVHAVQNTGVKGWEKEMLVFICCECVLLRVWQAWVSKLHLLQNKDPESDRIQHEVSMLLPLGLKLSA